MDELLEKKKYDRTYVEIDLEAIKHNIRCEREKVGDKVKIMAIIKANAYGHGDIEVAEALKDEVDAYGVAIIEEALKLRKAGVTKMILILGHTGKIWYDDLIKNQNHLSNRQYTVMKWQKFSVKRQCVLERRQRFILKSIPEWGALDFSL